MAPLALDPALWYHDCWHTNEETAMSKKKIGKNELWKLDRGRASERAMLSTRPNGKSGLSNSSHILAIKARSRRSG